MHAPTRVFYPGRAKLAVVLLGGLALTATCLWLLLDPDVEVSLKARAAAWIGVPFFAVGSLYVAYRLLWRRPSVVLDAQGLYDNASMAAVGLVPWSEIAGVRVFAVRNQKMVGIGLHDDERLLARLGAVRKRLARANMAMGYPLVVIPEAAVSVAAEALAEEIAQRQGGHAGGVVR
jgi:hypothetical protein